MADAEALRLAGNQTAHARGRGGQGLCVRTRSQYYWMSAKHQRWAMQRLGHGFVRLPSSDPKSVLGGLPGVFREINKQL